MKVSTEQVEKQITSEKSSQVNESSLSVAVERFLGSLVGLLASYSWLLADLQWTEAHGALVAHRLTASETLLLKNVVTALENHEGA